MKSLILVWLLAAGLAHAGPAVKRYGLFLSPKHAEATKAAAAPRGFSPAGGVGTYLPMKGYCVGVTNSPHGKMELTAEALAPANQGVLFEYAVVMGPESWTQMAWFSAYPKAQQVFAGLTTDEDVVYIRAITTTTPPEGMAFMAASGGGAIWTNPKLSGVRVWRGVR